MQLVIRQVVSIMLLVAPAASVVLGADWPTQSGSPQREGWARSEKVFTKENINGLDLLYKYQSDNKSKGLDSLTSPLVNGLLITYRGFKEMLVFSGSSDNVYAVDADLNKLIWKTHFTYEADQKPLRQPTAACPGGLTAAAAMMGSSSAGVSFGRRPPPTPAGRKAPIGGQGFGSLGAFFAVSSDGYLHTLNASTGQDLIPPAKFLPPNVRVSALNVSDNRVYAATSGNCGGSADAVYAIDLGSADKKVSTLPIPGKAIAGGAGTAIGTDGTLYIQAPSEQGSTDGMSHRTVLALDPDTLGVKDYFVEPDTLGVHKHLNMPGPTPLVFSWKGKDMIVAASGDGRLYLLDSTSLGGPDHHKPSLETDPIASVDASSVGNGFKGGFSSWSDAASGVRWLYASLAGPPQAAVKFAMQNGDVTEGSVVAFKLQDQNGAPALTPAWISSNISSPAATVTTGGLVFALSTGKPTSDSKPNGKMYTVAEIEKASTHATLYALDSETGKQLYSSGNVISSPSPSGGLAVANGRIYFATSDNSMNAFGFSKMQPQLTDK